MNNHLPNEKFKYLHPKDRIVMIMERVYAYEMTTTSGGNISIKDDNGDIWVTPGGIDKGSLTRDDIVCVKPDGKVVGKHKPSSEYPFHLAIYNVRPDIKAVLHAHPPALVSFSAAGCVPRTDLLPNVEKICGDIDFVPYALPGSNALGEKIACSFEKGCNSVLLENHGTVVGAADLFTAYQRFEMLDYTARIQIKATILGAPKAIGELDHDIYEQKYNELPEFTPALPNSAERELRQEMCKFIHRSYDQKLFTSTEGTFACRLSENQYLITPFGFDRKYIAPQDIVLINAGCREAGKLPSRSVQLHHTIFETQPDINAIVIAHPPNLMAFNITDQTLDSKIIPEAYILLREIQSLPFATPILDHEKVASTLNNVQPISMFQNNGIIVTGPNLLTAFDRLEVAEYTAKAVLGAYQIGHVNSMGDSVIDELKEAFNLAG
ncbi:class II aldolase/adducin family protein [Thalassotalea sp. PLHSN55]|uniref:class II aldolase/adducin family protein n=1 Tax=Thalassotalea sp. PLHSN55 TaxID=3435888 RepID=UPI003F84C299